MKKAKAFLFDFDGTLVDTMEGFADIAGRIISKFHPEESFEAARERYLQTSGVPFHQQLEIIFPGEPTNTEKAALFEEMKKEGFFASSFSDEVREAINGLRERGFLAGVSSNNFQELIDRFVSTGGLEFDIVLGYRHGFEKGKDHFDYIMEKFSLDREELVFVGDSIKDAEKAINNGVRFIGLCGTFTDADFQKVRSGLQTIQSIRELLTLCDQ